MIHIFIECTLIVLLAAVVIGWYRDGMALRANNAKLLQAITVRFRRSVLASRRRQKRANLRVRLLLERHRGAIDALTAKHDAIVASVEAKRQKAIDEAAPFVGEAIGLRDIVEFLEGERGKFKAGVLRFGKQLDVAKASADLIKVGMQLTEWVKGFVQVSQNLLPAPLKKLAGNP